ncbi:Pseudouridine synthase [Roseimaritima ulvae]|uniref:Pseudouridine synthase n=1 Tax=Roseimaritima ulvae TaxID=980254 RepID=A0A5B9R041_9BACT|nr:RluA family pseudouridine synthase [Roseimaritima ulvae]QEG42786.1 Pseudouridine synthase [Roseimaritima ulvae]
MSKEQRGELSVDGAAVESTATDSAASEGSSAAREFIVPESVAGTRIDIFLTAAIDGYSREQLRRAVHEGAAEVDGRVVRPSFKIRTGQQIRFVVPEPVADGPLPENIPLDILYEDDGFIAVNKPAGMVVHPARGNWSGTLTSALAYHFQSLSDIGGPARPGIVHRLDRDTSGVILVAKTNAVHIDLAAQFAERTVEKEYLALAAGRIDHDRDQIEAPIGRHPFQRDKMAIRENHSTSKPASTFYEVIERFATVTFVRLRPKTGRTHQIRVHLDHIGTPVLCDRLYGGHATLTLSQLLKRRPTEDEPPILQRQALHAYQITIRHPQSGQPMTFTAPLHDDMQNALKQLQTHST